MLRRVSHTVRNQRVGLVKYKREAQMCTVLVLEIFGRKDE
jgi:hypothetical protein